MQDQNQRYRKIKTLCSLSKSEHLVQLPAREKNKLLSTRYKATSHKKMVLGIQIPKVFNVKQHRSQTIQPLNVAFRNPYQKFVRQLNMVLPTPQQKFYEFLDIAPFNRIQHHTELIQHFLKHYKFFKDHPPQIIRQIAKDVRIRNQRQLQDQLLLVVEKGQCTYDAETYTKGHVVGRKQLRSSQLLCSPQARFITLVRHQYNGRVAAYLNKEKQKFSNFLSGIQTFKMLSKKVFERLMQNLSLYFFCENQHLCRFGEEASHIFIVFQGKASRSVIVQFDRTNKIPMFKHSKIIKILSKSYEHKIEFQSQDLIGVAQVIDHIQIRKQNVNFQQNSVILGLDKHLFQQNLDQYIIDRLRKQNLKKYPATYDKLCEKYQKQKIHLRQEELRKIQALKGTITSGTTQSKAFKIGNIIKKYQSNIRKSQTMNLLQSKIHQRREQRQ